MPAEPSSATCAACGADLAGTRFCESCGARREQASPADTVHIEAQTPTDDTNQSGGLTTGTKRKLLLSGRAKIIVLASAGLSLIVAIVLVAVAVGASNQSTLDTAREAYAATVQELDELAESRKDAVDVGQALLDAITAEDVSDPTVLDALAEALSTTADLSPIVPLSPSSENDPATLDQERSALQSLVDDLQTEVAAIMTAITMVENSRAAQQLSAASADLDAAIAEGEIALDDSEGRVSDESVRDTLAEALDGARGVRDSSSATPEDMAIEATSVRSAVAAVADARVPVFTDVNGTWCYWENDSWCVSISLPRVGDDSVIQKPGADSFYPPRGDGWTYVVPGEPCFTTVVGSSNGDPFESAVFSYCPQGVSSSDPFQNFNNAQFDRIYISQQGAIDPYFRQSEWSPAVGH